MRLAATWAASGPGCYNAARDNSTDGGRAGLLAMRLDFGQVAPILNYMVKYSDHALDRTFAALADPTRRALLARLDGQHSVSVSELAQPFAMSLPAIMKHLDVLSDAGLIARAKTGRVVACRLTAGPMEQAMDWLNRYQRFWSEGLDRLAAFVEEENAHQIKRRRRSRHPTEPYPQTSSQCAAGESLRGVDRPGKNSPMVRARAGRRRLGTGRDRCPDRRPLPFSFEMQDGEYHEVTGVYREMVPNQRLAFSWAWHSTPERESQVTVSLEARRRRHAADATP